MNSVTLHRERSDTKGTKTRKEKEGRIRHLYVADGVALVIRTEAHVTCPMLHVTLVKDIILNWHGVHWELFYFHSYAPIKLLLSLLLS